MRYTNLTNGGPLYVFVRAGKIVRTTPIDFDASDPSSWVTKARGRTFTPRRTATVSPHALAMKSLVHSTSRLLHPMRRVDFDPAGERNVGRRGLAGYVRISWKEALDIVAGEILRMKQEHGPGAIAIAQPAHHQWGNINYWLSALYRFGNLIGHTKVAFSPISWEGWYWGAMHHYGNNMRLGVPASPAGIRAVSRAPRIRAHRSCAQSHRADVGGQVAAGAAGHGPGAGDRRDARVGGRWTL
jgi:trimethylamine-N-oxide reductase (cytochrome c)